MRGTRRQTNKALSSPVLMLGAERSLVIVSTFFWGWALVEVMPHWPVLLVIPSFIATIAGLRFIARRDPQGVAVFRANSRFLLQNRLYVTSGFANNIKKVRKVRTVPLDSLLRIS